MSDDNKDYITVQYNCKGFRDKEPSIDAGKGHGDYILDPYPYEELNKIPNWRKVLSPIWSDELFVYNGLYYRSIEHAVQAIKFTFYGMRDIAYSFCVDSGQTPGIHDGVEAKRLRNCVRVNREDYLEW
jgi:hypothetical protein